MEKLSGLVLDYFDDPAGEVMKQVFPTVESIPEVIKQAMPMASTDRANLPDDVFALVLHNGDTVLRKYACIDEGNTALHVEYFLKTAGKLPVEAQKTAAVNLITACGWYNIEPPAELQKIAVSGRWVVSRVGAAAEKAPTARVAEFAKKTRGGLKGAWDKVRMAEEAASSGKLPLGQSPSLAAIKKGIGANQSALKRETAASTAEHVLKARGAT